MKMNTQIAMQGQQPDLIGAAHRGFTAGRQNALAGLYREHGQGIAAGDQNALNALAHFDPEAAVDIKRTQQETRYAEESHEWDREKLGFLRDEATRKATEHARKLSAEEAAAEKARVDELLTGASAFLKSGNEAGYNEWLTSKGVDVAEYPFAHLEPNIMALQVAKDALDAVGGNGAKDQRDRKILEYEHLYGVDKGTAVALADGLIKSVTDPITRETSLVDMRTGQPWSGVNGGTQPAVTQVDQAPEETTTTKQPNLSFGPSIEGAGDAFGLEGAAKGALNTIGGAVGVTPYPDVQSAQSDFAVLRESLTQDISGAYNGRVPAFLQKNIQELTPQSGNVFESTDKAQSKLKALQRSLEGELQSAESSLRRRMTPTARQELETQINSIQTALGRIGRALNSFDGGSQNKTSNGVTWSIE